MSTLEETYNFVRQSEDQRKKLREDAAWRDREMKRLLAQSNVIQSRVQASRDARIRHIKPR